MGVKSTSQLGVFAPNSCCEREKESVFYHGVTLIKSTIFQDSTDAKISWGIQMEMDGIKKKENSELVRYVSRWEWRHWVWEELNEERDECAQKHTVWNSQKMNENMIKMK